MLLTTFTLTACITQPTQRLPKLLFRNIIAASDYNYGAQGKALQNNNAHFLKFKTEETYNPYLSFQERKKITRNRYIYSKK